MLARCAVALPNRYTPLYLAPRAAWLASEGRFEEASTEQESARILITEQANYLTGAPYHQSLLGHPYTKIVLA